MTTTSEQALEARIQERGLEAPRLKPSDLDAAIKSTSYYTFPDTNHTICIITLQNGFTVSGENACASKENWREDIAQELAYKNAREKMWALLGYALKDQIARTTAMSQGLVAGSSFAAVIDKAWIAKLCQEVNRAYCTALGDPSQPSWEDAPAAQKASLLAGVEMHLKNPAAKPSDSHESWLKQKTEEGWKYGPVKNVEAKEHPCFVPYEELPKEQQAKDFIFSSIVKTIANSVFRVTD